MIIVVSMVILVGKNSWEGYTIKCPMSDINRPKNCIGFFPTHARFLQIKIKTVTRSSFLDQTKRTNRALSLDLKKSSLNK